MPNHCENDLTLYGPKYYIDQVVKTHFVKDTNGELTFDFDTVIHMPDEEQANWYDWRKRNWGTKWNAYETNGVTVENWRSDQSKKLTTSFSTAWSPPTPVILELAARYPKLIVVMRSYEAGMCYQTYIRVRGNKISKQYQKEYRGRRGG